MAKTLDVGPEVKWDKNRDEKFEIHTDGDFCMKMGSVWVKWSAIDRENCLVDVVTNASPLFRHYIGKDWKETHDELMATGKYRIESVS